VNTGGKATVLETDHSPSYSDEVKNAWTTVSVPYAFMARTGTSLSFRR